ncbi:MerR family transcriptional regulator [Enterococcus sp. LJL120]
MFQIGEFSKLSGTSTRMLRHYEKLGLLLPQKTDEYTGYRFYNAGQLQKINRIKKLQAMGLSLVVIQQILSEEDPQVLKKHLAIREVEAAEELKKIQQQQALMNSLQEVLGSEKALDYHVVQKTLPANFVMSTRQVIADAAGESVLWQKLFTIAEEQKVQFATPALALSIYHDPEYHEENIDLEIQMAVLRDYQETETIKFFETPALPVASVTFNGPYEQMPDVMAALGQWLEINHHRLAGPMLNINHVSPAQDPNPENWVTEACIVIAPINGEDERNG